MLQFRRITTQGRFIPQIDGLRFVAIASVVLFHVYANFQNGIVPASPTFDSDLPKRGVELFFAISGFILGVPFASHFLRQSAKVDLKQYFLRRLTRLEPPYFISLFVWAADQIIMGHRNLREMGPHLLASFAYLHNLIFGAFNRPVNGVAWSLEIEIQFYLLVPALALLFALNRSAVRRVALATLMLGIGLCGSALYRIPTLRYSIVYYLAFFLAGFLICDLYLTRGEWKPSLSWDLLALGAWPLVWLLGNKTSHILLPFLIVALYLAAFRGRICAAVFSHPWISGIGGMCYSIYLFHPLVIAAMGRLTRALHLGQNFWAYFGLQTMLIAPAVLLLCGGFFLLIERPCMDRYWPQKLWRKVREFVQPGRFQTVSPAVATGAAVGGPALIAVPAPVPGSEPARLPVPSDAQPAADSSIS
ncbi:MAG TPA: acyltransferase [Terriglobales bacterium]|nr:acyltransferase [Terriglobales bacterium]